MKNIQELFLQFFFFFCSAEENNKNKEIKGKKCTIHTVVHSFSSCNWGFCISFHIRVKAITDVSGLLSECSQVYF